MATHKIANKLNPTLQAMNTVDLLMGREGLHIEFNGYHTVVWSDKLPESRYKLVTESDGQDVTELPCFEEIKLILIE